MQTVSTSDTTVDDDRDYNVLHEHLRGSLAKVSGPLFTTDATGLFDAFLAALPAAHRQYYDCRSCRRFVERVGGLVTIDVQGIDDSPFWDSFRPNGVNVFRGAVDGLSDMVNDASVTGVFLSEEAVWGVESNPSPKAKGGVWHHMHAVPSPAMVHHHATLSDSQVMAAKREDHTMLCRGLAEFPIDVVRQAHSLLTVGALYRSEKCIGVAKWLLDLHEARAATKNNRVRENLAWRAVASAPPGYAHVRSTMIGTLLEDIQSGAPIEAIRQRFDAKMAPLQYRRPTAAPTDGQLAAAEALIAKMASAGSLARRYARIEEILPHAIWTPKPADTNAVDGSVFGHLKAATKDAPIDVSAQTITWEKFARTVLPTAERIEFLTPPHAESYFAFVTAEDPAAPPILQWDREDARNPVSWYLHAHGSPPSQFGLTYTAYVDVEAVTLQPSSWGQSLSHMGEGAYFLLKGARDGASATSGIALFPEILKSEYHGIRAALEAYSRSKTLGGVERSDACGVCIQKSGYRPRPLTFRVTVQGTRVLYNIDRFD